MNQLILPFVVAVVMTINSHRITPTPIASPAQNSQKHIVCIDPGHGADDPGAIEEDITEANVVLDIANRLNKLLHQQGYQTVLTRTDNNTNPTNSERAAICNNGHANVLISIHLNFNDDPTLDYTQGLYGTEEKDKQFSDFLTQAVSSNLNVSNGDTTDFEDNLMLRANMPASLQEVVFISSPEEYQLFSQGNGTRQEEIAQALDDGITNWFMQKK